MRFGSSHVDGVRRELSRSDIQWRCHGLASCGAASCMQTRGHEGATHVSRLSAKMPPPPKPMFPSGSPPRWARARLGYTLCEWFLWSGRWNDLWPCASWSGLQEHIELPVLSFRISCWNRPSAEDPACGFSCCRGRSWSAPMLPNRHPPTPPPPPPPPSDL